MSTDGANTSGEVTFVNRFTVHASPEEFERVFAEVSEFMTRQDGFLRNTLLQHVDEPHSFINIAHWRDAASFRKALAHPAFKPHAMTLRGLSASEPNLYAPRRSFSAGPAGDEAGRDLP
ncbi:antibiotic biosynthesis monooxygenase [Actinomadura craniellae]|uniref:Antibiotic biosynthesis monooxygenase n=1 Tax=Actinomadura craniellae TaxID=2231787 RepID=A0A365H0X3_9ACTN|nr:antibiotic biosynthesis monooxygenase family protein [Actinomadura craniellae]RAY12727.1 antibiotic biosynthesis monooxygenase [Actinomadura craniellae]